MAPRAMLLVGALLLGAGGHPVARATQDEVVASIHPVYVSQDGTDFAIAVVCRADATPTASWTWVSCLVDGEYGDIRVPPESPVSPGGLIWNPSFNQVPGPSAVALWVGTNPPPFQACAYAEAGFNQPTGGETVVVRHGPVCRTVEA